jgi:hypothetical protein
MEVREEVWITILVAVTFTDGKYPYVVLHVLFPLFYVLGSLDSISLSSAREQNKYIPTRWQYNLDNNAHFLVYLNLWEI